MLKKFFLVSSLLVTSLSAQAGLISGTHTTAGGKSANLQGLEWMPLTWTAGFTRNQVENANGFTDKNKNVWKMGDWRYATRAETSLLLSSIHGGPGASRTSYDALNSDGAAWFAQTFGFTVSSSTSFHSGFNYGASGECRSNGCPIGQTILRLSENGAPLLGFIVDSQGLSASVSPQYILKHNVARQLSGHLLVRNASVPVTPVSAPSALSLFALGLCGLLLRRRKIAA